MQEIILHALFESGTTEVQDLERYIKDDVERYGGRLSELDRKLDTAYQEQVHNLTRSLRGVLIDSIFFNSLKRKQTLKMTTQCLQKMAMRSSRQFFMYLLSNVSLVSYLQSIQG